MGYRTDSSDDLGDVLAALATIEPFTTDDPDADDRLMMAAEVGGGRRAVITGVGTLIRMFTDRLTAIGRERGHPDAPLVIPVVVSWLHETALVNDEIIPTMAGALTAATLGQHPVRWRERFGPIPDLELLPWTYTTAFLAHLVDEQTGQIGSAITMAREYCASVVPDDPRGILGTPGSD